MIGRKVGVAAALVVVTGSSAAFGQVVPTTTTQIVDALTGPFWVAFPLVLTAVATIVVAFFVVKAVKRAFQHRSV